MGSNVLFLLLKYMDKLKPSFYTEFLLFALDVFCEMHSSELPFLSKIKGDFPPSPNQMQYGPQGFKLGTRQMIWLK